MRNRSLGLQDDVAAVPTLRKWIDDGLGRFEFGRAMQVHAEGGRIAMQILHAGRYAYHPMAVAPSKKRAPINVARRPARAPNLRSGPTRR